MGDSLVVEVSTKEEGCDQSGVRGWRSLRFGGKMVRLA